MILAAVVGLVLVGECCVLFVILRQYGRALLRQDDLRDRMLALEDAVRDLASRLPLPPATAGADGHVSAFVGLPIGAQAPDFTLPDLDGRSRRLAEYLGQQLVVVFFSLECGFCQEMAPRLGDIGRSLRTLLISRGSPSEHRRLAQEHGWNADVLLEPGWEVAQSYHANGTPTGYVVDADGRIASNLLVGTDAVLEALQSGADSNGLSADSLRAKENAASERARAAGLRVRESRLNRQGLAAGTPAPDFELPDLDGHTRSLKEFRGHRVLLVFSDPQCGPCQALAPDLEKLHRRAEGLQLVMVSRGDLEANRAKAREHGLTFPVLLQRHWEISSAYGMFATPVGYVIDEHGVIAREPAIGADAILSAADERTIRS